MTNPEEEILKFSYIMLTKNIELQMKTSLEKIFWVSLSYQEMIFNIC